MLKNREQKVVEEGMTFERPRGGRFYICPEVTKLLKEFRQTGLRWESGGVLLGRHLIEGNDIIVDHATKPMFGDRRHRFSFFRARRRHQREINRQWRISNGTCTYLGEWHTHPEPSPTPSSVDLKTWHRKLEKDTYSEVLFFLIVGTEEVRVWEGKLSHRNRPLEELKQK